MGWIAAAAAVVGALISKDASDDASDANIDANDAAISEQRRALEEFFARLQPFTDIGLEAGEELRNLLFNPEASLEQINPVVDILREQGFEQIQETAAAGGRLGSGGTLKDLTQFNTDLTTTVIPQLQNQRFNQLFNVLSLGQSSAAGQGAGLLNTTNNISGLQTNSGQVRGENAVNNANIFNNALGSFTQIAGQNSEDSSDEDFESDRNSNRGGAF